MLHRADHPQRVHRHARVDALAQEPLDRFAVAPYLVEAHLHLDQAREQRVALVLGVLGDRPGALGEGGHGAHAEHTQRVFGAPQRRLPLRELRAENAGELAQVVALQPRRDRDEPLGHRVHGGRHGHGIAASQLEPEEVPVQVGAHLQLVGQFQRRFVRRVDGELDLAAARQRRGRGHPREPEVGAHRIARRAARHRIARRAREQRETAGGGRIVHHQPVLARQHVLLDPERPEHVGVAGLGGMQVQAARAHRVIEHGVRLQQLHPPGGDRQLALPDGAFVAEFLVGNADPHDGLRHVAGRQEHRGDHAETRDGQRHREHEPAEATHRAEIAQPLGLLQLLGLAAHGEGERAAGGRERVTGHGRSRHP